MQSGEIQMSQTLIINPIEEFVADIKHRVRDNGGYCLYAEKTSKANKCPKYCKSSDECLCGMYIKDISYQDPEEGT